MKKTQQSRTRSRPSTKPTADTPQPETPAAPDATAESDITSHAKESKKAAKPVKPKARRAAAPRKTTRVASKAADYASSAPEAPGEAASAPPPPVIVGEPVDPTSTVRGRRASSKPSKPKQAPKLAAARRTTKAHGATVDAEVIDRPATPAATFERPVSDTTTPTTVLSKTDTGSPDAGGLRILMIASEAVPFAKTGGLADVAGALPGALGRLGHSVTLVLPRYRGVLVDGSPIATLNLQLGADRLTADVYEAPLGPGARAWLIDTPSLYDRDGLYNVNGADHPDNPRRFAFLTRAAFEAARTIGFTPDIVHAHDWQGGLAPVYLETSYAQDRVFGGVPCVFTIHNIAYTGTFDPAWLPALDLGWELFRPESIEYWSRISFLKAGINFSAKVTTVSPTYAREILTPEFAYGFEGILRARGADLVGILNGIDADTWNPATDRHIPKTYSADDLSGKRDAKRALLQAYGLPWDDEAMDEPVIGMVSRMIDQKGLDLIANVASELPTLGARFVVLGTGEPRYESMWRALADRHPDRIAVKVGFDEPLSHLVEAGADLFLMPSHYEPCGLNQMYSLRYGTLPLVRATGGLDDTVENYDPYTGRGNGFKFWEPSGPAMLNTLRWALRVYDHPDVWQRLQKSGMQLDFSWSRSAGEYARLYIQVLTAAGRPVPVAYRI
jgi:starch synthase